MVPICDSNQYRREASCDGKEPLQFIIGDVSVNSSSSKECFCTSREQCVCTSTAHCFGSMSLPVVMVVQIGDYNQCRCEASCGGKESLPVVMVVQIGDPNHRPSCLTYWTCLTCLTCLTYLT